MKKKTAARTTFAVAAAVMVIVAVEPAKLVKKKLCLSSPYQCSFPPRSSPITTPSPSLPPYRHPHNAATAATFTPTTLTRSRFRRRHLHPHHPNTLPPPPPLSRSAFPPSAPRLSECFLEVMWRNIDFFLDSSPEGDEVL